MTEEEQLERYKNFNKRLYVENCQELAKCCFIINLIVLIIFRQFIAVPALIVMLISYRVSMDGNDLAIGGFYEASNRYFKVSDCLNAIELAMTIAGLISVFV